MAIAHALLGLLAIRPMHGYELRAEFEERLGALWSLNFGQVYPALQRLAEEGLVDVTVERGDARERKVYTITPAGRRELERWLALQPEPPRIQREETFLRLAVALWSSPDGLPTVIRQRRRVLQASLADLAAIRDDLDPERDVMVLLMLEAAVLRIDAELKWLDQLDDQLPRWIRPQDSMGA